MWYNRSTKYTPRDALTSRGSKLKGLAHMSKCTPKRPAKQLPNGDIEIPLTKGYSTTVSPEDMDLANRHWCAFVKRGRVYAISNKERMNRIILARILGRPLLDTELADHADNNSLNNRRDNIRLANFAQNVWNSKMKTGNSTKLKGAFKHKNRFRSQIKVNGKAIHLGVFNTAEDAHRAYCEAAIRYFGEFARSK